MTALPCRKSWNQNASARNSQVQRKTPRTAEKRAGYRAMRLACMIFIGMGAVHALTDNQIAVQAGNIYPLNLYVNEAAQHWAAFYGLATTTGTASQPSFIPDVYNQSDPMATHPRVYDVNASYGPPCLTRSDWLFISDTNEVHWADLAAADIAGLNKMADVQPGLSEDASHFFYSNGSVVLTEKSYHQLPWISLPAQDNATFTEYVLQDAVNGHLVFAIPLAYPSIRGFDGTPVNYESIIPRGPTYYFMYDPALCMPQTSGSSSPQSNPLAALTNQKPAASIGSDARTPSSNSPGPTSSTSVLPSLPVMQTLPTPPNIPLPEPEPAIAPGQTVHVVAAQSQQAAIQADITAHKTVFNIQLTSPKTGEFTAIVDFPIPIEYFENGAASVNVQKAQDQGNTVQASGKKAWYFDTETTEKYRLQKIGNFTRMLWVLETHAGDVFDIRATVHRALTAARVQLTAIHIVRGNWVPALVPTAKVQSQLQFQVQTLPSPDWTWLMLPVISLLAAAGWMVAKRPWMAQYANPKHWHYIYYYFTHKRRG